MPDTLMGYPVSLTSKQQKQIDEHYKSDYTEIKEAKERITKINIKDRKPRIKIKDKKMIKTARLIVTYKCYNECLGCCNKQLDKNLIQTIESVDELKDYDEIAITGGEPFLFFKNLKELIYQIRLNSKQKIFIYTTPVYRIEDFNEILPFVNGITITIHNQQDNKKFIDSFFNLKYTKNKTLRLNVFNPIKDKLYENLDENWKVKYIDWIENCPLPTNETLFQLKQIWE